MIVLGSISALNWILYARAFEREGIPTIGLQSAAAFLAPISAFLVLAVIYTYFQGKSGNKISFEEAVFHVSLASTPIVINGMMLLLWAYFAHNWTAYILSPFAVLLMAGVMAYEAFTPSVVAPGGEYLYVLKGMLIDYGAAWIAFFMLYAYPVRAGRTRIWMVITAIVFLYIIALLGHYLVVLGVSILILLIYKIKEVKTEVRARILTYIEENPGIHFRGLVTALNINRGTLYYHLNVLEKLKLVKSSRLGRRKVFYSDSGEDSSYISGTGKKIWEYVRDNPDSSARDIVASLNLSPSTVSYHLKNLEERGFIIINRKGRKIRVRDGNSPCQNL